MGTEHNEVITAEVTGAVMQNEAATVSSAVGFKRHRSGKFARIIAALVCACAVVLAVPAVYSWAVDTTPDYSWYTSDPGATTYTISNARQWNGFAAMVNGTADVDGDGTVDAAQTFEGKTIQLPENGAINFFGSQVTPAGGQNGTLFNGTLDGRGTSVDNFAIDASTGTTNVGLIGQAGDKSQIKDVTIGSSASVKLVQDEGGSVIENVGLVVGQTTGSVTNCTNKGSLTITSAVEQSEHVNFLVRSVGGVVGIGKGDISNCTNLGAVSVSQTSTPRTDNEQSILAINIGGVVGSAGSIDSSQLVDPSDTDVQPASKRDVENIHGTVSNCSNSGVITLDTPSEAGLDRFGQTAYAQSSNVGGVIGYSRASVTNCTNYGYIDGMRSTGVSGVVGALRSATTTSSYSGNFSQEGADDGMAASAKDDELTISGCQNFADVRGFVFAAGICGRTGTYTTVTSSINSAGTYIVALRWNKPFPAGVVGSAYGTVSYCANLGTVVAATDFDESTKRYTTSGGYYAAGLVGNTAYFTDSESVRNSPLPEVFGCYNAGGVYAIDDMRQRALVGDNSGFVHDNLALENCVSTKRLVYGDSEGDQESSGGTASNNSFATKDELMAKTSMSTGLTSLSVLNTNCDATNWASYWVKSSDKTNGGYPVLDWQSSTSRTDISNATVEWAADAPYTGLASVPQASVTAADGTKLVQGVDFKVIPQADATELTYGERPYAATVEGIGLYSGTAEQTFAYGIGKGDLADCSVTIDSKTYNAAAQIPDDSGVHVYNKAGVEIDSSEYEFEVDPSSQNLTDGKAINAKKYTILITAKDSSEHFEGTNNSGKWSIKTASIICTTADDKTKANRATPDGVTCLGETQAWYSNTLHKDAPDSELPVFAYTGYPIKPTVTGATLTGPTVDGKVALTEGVDYRVVYGQSQIDTAGGIVVDNIGKEGGTDYGYIMVRYVSGGNFSNYEIMKFLIADTGATCDLSKAEIRGCEDVIYEGEAGEYRPVTVWYAGSQLTEGTDYTIEYQNNDKVGTAKFTITAKGDRFTGSRQGSFDIVEGIPYTLSYDYNDDGTASVTGIEYHGVLDTYKVTIPSTVTQDGKTYTVTSIAEKSFGSNNSGDLTESMKKVSSVEIPATVETIANYAFCAVDFSSSANRSNLKSVTFAEGSKLTSIGEGAFRNSLITEITIPSGVETIGRRAFMNCDNLSTVVFESTSSSKPVIDNLAFQNVKNVKATAYESATGVATYVRTTIASQAWTLEVKEDPAPVEKWKRLSGDDALGTMAAVVQEGFDSADTVVVATINGYWDALAASALAGVCDAPVLLTSADSLSSETADEIKRLNASKVYIAGGVVSVSNYVESQLKNLVGEDNVTRLAGETAVETSNYISEEANKIEHADTCIIATVNSYYDALSIAPIAYSQGYSLYLTKGDTTLAASTVEDIKAAGYTKAIIVGGPVSVSDLVQTVQLPSAGISSSNVLRLGEANAWQTSEAIADYGVDTLHMTADNMGVADGNGYWDALTGAALCGRLGSVLVLVPHDDISSGATYDPYCIDHFVKSHASSITRGYVFGGTASVPVSTFNALVEATK